VANRLESVAPRMQPQDAHDISRMANIVSNMLGDVGEAFSARDVRRAIDVLKADAELDRLRNLVFIRHIENPENEPRQESFHLVFISQALERAGDHAKNLAEEICHLVSGRSVRHIMREYDRPVEQVYFERMRRGKKPD
jgi:phosphate transport system protein